MVDHGDHFDNQYAHAIRKSARERVQESATFGRKKETMGLYEFTSWEIELSERNDSWTRSLNELHDDMSQDKFGCQQRIFVVEHQDQYENYGSKHLNRSSSFENFDSFQCNYGTRRINQSL